MELNNSQMVMVTELKATIIDKMKGYGAEYTAIRDKCIEAGRNHWLVTNKKEQDDAISAALYLHAMDDKQREAVNLLSDFMEQQNR